MRYNTAHIMTKFNITRLNEEQLKFLDMSNKKEKYLEHTIFILLGISILLNCFEGILSYLSIVSCTALIIVAFYKYYFSSMCFKYIKSWKDES